MNGLSARHKRISSRSSRAKLPWFGMKLRAQSCTPPAGSPGRAPVSRLPGRKKVRKVAGSNPVISARAGRVTPRRQCRNPTRPSIHPISTHHGGDELVRSRLFGKQDLQDRKVQGLLPLLVTAQRRQLQALLLDLQPALQLCGAARGPCGGVCCSKRSRS